MKAVGKIFPFLLAVNVLAIAKVRGETQSEEIIRH